MKMVKDALIPETFACHKHKLQSHYVFWQSWILTAAAILQNKYQRKGISKMINRLPSRDLFIWLSSIHTIFVPLLYFSLLSSHFLVHNHLFSSFHFFCASSIHSLPHSFISLFLSPPFGVFIGVKCIETFTFQPHASSPPNFCTNECDKS